MKVLRFLIILVLILVVGYLVLCLVSPKEINVEKSTAINAPAPVVWEQMVHFKNWQNWSPWEEMDSTITNEYTGVDGQEGSTSHFTSEKSGEGKMTNTSVNGMKMTYNLEFLKPFQAMTTGYVQVTEENGMTKATQSFHEDVPFMMRGASALMGGEKIIAKSFERGLELLKSYSEAHASDMKIQDVQYPGHTYAAVRKEINISEMEKFMGDSYTMLGKEAGPRITGPASCLAYKWDMENQKADLAPCFPVSGTEPVNGASMINVPASAAYMIEYKGPYSGFMAVHEALGKHTGMMGKEPTLVLEEYIVGPGNNVDSTQYVYKVYYLHD